MSALAAAGAGLAIGAATLLANATTGGPDLVGIAAVITASAGAIGTLGMLFLAIRRTRETPITPEDIARAVNEGLHPPAPLDGGDRHAP